MNCCEVQCLRPHSLMLSLSKYEGGNASSLYAMGERAQPSSYFDRLSMREVGWVCSCNAQIQFLAMLREKQVETHHAS